MATRLGSPSPSPRPLPPPTCYTCGGPADAIAVPGHGCPTCGAATPEVEDLGTADWVDEVRALLGANLPLILWGPPGVGKTRRIEAAARQCAATRGGPVVTVLGGSYDPTEILGLPAQVEGAHGPEIRRLPFAWVRALRDAGRGVLFLDELSLAPPAVQAALLRVLLDRVVGDEPLPPEIRVIAAANPPDCTAGGIELSPPAANRLAHIEVGRYGEEPVAAGPEGSGGKTRNQALAEALAPDWVAWLPAGCAATAGQRHAAELVAGFVRASPHALFAFPADEAARGGPWASPRSWHHATLALGSCIDAGAQGQGVRLARRFVGEAWGEAFSTYVRAADLPAPRAVLDGTSAWKPDLARPDVAGAVMASTAVEAVHSAAPKGTPVATWRAVDVDRAWGVVLACADAGLADVARHACRTLQTWRSRESGAPLALGTHEARAVVRLAPIIATAARAAAGGTP